MLVPLTPDENERLRALSRYDLLDTPPNPALDRLTALAARLFGVPIALVTLVDWERVWFKSHHGVNFCETARGDSFCTRTILCPSHEALVIPDATLDERFADNPYVTDAPGMRFYAGVPLRATGEAIGCFCVIDTQPRVFSDEEIATLHDLAAAAADTIQLGIAQVRAREEAAERHWTEEALRRSEARLRRLAANAPGMLYQFVRRPDGSFHFPFVGEGCRELFGVEPLAIYERPELVLDTLDPDALAAFQASAAESARTLQPWRLCVPYRAPDGTDRWIEGISRPEVQEDRKVVWHGMLSDVTERKRVEGEAARAARRVRALLESIGEAFFSLDRDWRFTYVNDHAEALLGRPRADLLGRVLWEVYPGAESNVFGQTYRRVMASGRPERVEDLSPTLKTWIEVHAYPSEEGLSIYFRDVSARKDAEREAKHAARRVRTVLESITNAFYSLDRDWRFTYVNDQAERQLDRRREDLLGRVFWEALPHKAEMDYFPRFHRAIQSGQPEEFEIFSPTRGKWFDIHAYPSDEGLSVYSQEITERVQAQRQMEDSHKLLRAIIDGTDNTIFIKDLEGRYLLINPAGAGLLGTTPEQVVGLDDFAFFPRKSARKIREIDQEIMSTGESRTYESSDFVNGVEHFFLSTKSPYRDAEGNLLGVIGIVREVTDQRNAAEALREAKEEAENANAAKSEFLSRMSHELRTPLNAILGFSQLLELGGLGQRQTESVGHILKAGRHLLGLIDEVLAISRIEAGRMNLSLEPVSVGDMVAECLSLVSRQASDRRITLDNRCTPKGAGQSVFVLADRQRLRQVLLNLLSNAVKYNREGGSVTVTQDEFEADSSPLEPRPPRLRLAVADTGRGLTTQEIARLFTPFERLGAERGPTEGTGLGLALSKGLVEAMEGRIGVAGVPDEGTTFWLELPLARDPREALADHARRKSGAAQGESSGTVLYVEDNLSNLRLIEMLLEDRPGMELLSAQQGLLGLEIARARRPDLILLDLHLPDLPGWEVLGILQEDPELRSIPVVIISADATPGRIERLRAAGAREFLTKPIDVPALLAVLRQYLSPRYPDEKEMATAEMMAADI